MKESSKKQVIKKTPSAKLIILPKVKKPTNKLSKSLITESGLSAVNPSAGCLITIRKILQKLASNMNKTNFMHSESSDHLSLSPNSANKQSKFLSAHPELFKTRDELKNRAIVSQSIKLLPIKNNHSLPKLSPEIANHLKIAVHKTWIQTLQLSYGVVPVENYRVYKYYIGKGNNHTIVKGIMSKRWWWNPTGIYTNANFVWTQGKHKETLKFMYKRTAFETGQLELEPVKTKLPYHLIAEQEHKSGLKLIRNTECYQKFEHLMLFDQRKIHNRLPHNEMICDKKHLLRNMTNHYKKIGANVFQHIPLTYHIETPEDIDFVLARSKRTKYWIVKPGENSNRGNGIFITDTISDIKNLMIGENRSFVVQKYIHKPLLFNKRKFDIRCFGLITCLGRRIQGFFYKEGYIRTASKEFNMKKIHDKFVHLTNDAIQSKAEDYGKFEPGNKLSYSDFNKTLKKTHTGKNFYVDILPQIQQKVTDTFQAVQDSICPNVHVNSFELLGYDFMVDQNLKAWLIEVNTNPCLELSSSYLAALIPAIIDNSFRIAVDPLFPPPTNHQRFDNWIQDSNLTNNFDLVFSGPSLIDNN